MNEILPSFKFIIPDKIYIKDPETSELGKKIIENSILLIDEIGFDTFTFKKLGIKISSNESSIYRYFESKHHILVYLFVWYWAWREYHLIFETHNVLNSEEKLKKALTLISRPSKYDSNFSHINEVILNKIMISENSKVYLTKMVDSENKEGYFSAYKRVIYRLRDIILEVNPNYIFASSLASTIIEGSLHQHYLKEHFKTITDCCTEKDLTPSDFFIDLTFTTLKNYNEKR